VIFNGAEDKVHGFS